MIEALNRFARLASNRSEVVGAALIILMVTMMVIPLSPQLIDVLLAVNITASILLVISAVLIESPLAFSSFPAILLMTTLFRLSLTISTTRQILLEADAGNIVQTFGEFVVGGNVAVGLVIFLIISVVNFLVITKGSERVAEVAARFSLDGMPGKQMSIDSDLRAGLINQAVAKKRRSDLEKESQLFGAMDGAIKFVKNDAIAGLVITVVNLLGGLTVGMLQKDMSFSEAGHIYTILSVGDGLVAIIPSLMISIAAGLVVTRVTKGDVDGSNTAQDMIRELGANSKALQISGIVCLMFAFVPGMPSIVFLITGAGLLFAWYKASVKADSPSAAKVAQDHANTTDFTKPTKMIDVLNTTVYSAVEVRIPKALEPTTANLMENICRAARNKTLEHLGILLPLFEYTRHDEEQLEIYVYGVPSLTINMSDKRLALRCPLEQLDPHLSSIEHQVEKDLITGRHDILVDPVLTPSLDQLALPYITFEDRIMEKVECLLIKKSSQLFTLNEAQRHMTNLGELYSEQLKELERVLPATKIVDVLQRLLREAVSIKNMRSILNSLIEWGQRERDPIIIAEQVRRGLFEQICHQHTHQKKLWVYVMSLEVEQLIRESTRSDGNSTFIDMDASSISQIVDLIERQIKPHLSGPFLPGIICSIDSRVFVRQIIEDQLFLIPVLSHQEISSNFQIKILGNIQLDEQLNPYSE